MELTYYGNTILKLILYLCLFCVPVSSPKKNQWNLWPLCPEISFFVSLSLLQLPTCLACLQCHHMVQILTLGKISPKPFYLLPTANTYMCDTTNSICLMVEYSLTFIIKTHCSTGSVTCTAEFCKYGLEMFQNRKCKALAWQSSNYFQRLPKLSVPRGELLPSHCWTGTLPHPDSSFHSG